MKILFFVSSLNAGGAERVASTLANAWGLRGDQVTLVPTFSGGGTAFYEIDSKVEVVWLAHRMRGSWLPKPLAKLAAMRKLVREKQPDVIVSFLTNVNVNVLLGLADMGVPIVVGERTNPAFSSSAGKVLQAMRRRLYPKAQVVTVQTQASIAAFQAMVPGMKQVAVVSNPLPQALDAVERLVRVEENRHCTLLAMGRMVPSKRFDVLIRVFANLAASYPEWTLVIRGDGPQRAALMQQVALLGMSERIRLPGKTSEPWAEMARAHAFAMTSEVEGFPNVLLEAMAMGLPAVTVDCPSGPREITADGRDAMLVPVGDEGALTAALSELMGDGVFRGVLGRRAAAAVRQRYQLAQVLQAWDEVFTAARGGQQQGAQA
ncbi:MAG TPA: glycosyltransferase family 4 protein [Alcaligenes sp.]|nr:glycosyltransferase family 4 protein [Alcaligenes sp.]HRL27256.1 glycosyltransferase family 4 protein [Alcaligenes sp.]